MDECDALSLLRNCTLSLAAKRGLTDTVSMDLYSLICSEREKKSHKGTDKECFINLSLNELLPNTEI